MNASTNALAYVRGNTRPTLLAAWQYAAVVSIRQSGDVVRVKPYDSANNAFRGEYVHDPVADTWTRVVLGRERNGDPMIIRHETTDLEMAACDAAATWHELFPNPLPYQATVVHTH